MAGGLSARQCKKESADGPAGSWRLHVRPERAFTQETEAQRKRGLKSSGSVERNTPGGASGVIPKK